ncbi:MAG: hypothetical protein EXS01_00910 [Phycisphaerales bacterium]|nr:hypothetical protein [Phycisphaerales bacterium]
MIISLCVALLFIVRPAPTAEQLAQAVQGAVDSMVLMQEGPSRGEWPYEGVYRVGGKIPFGYRIGGTAIVAEAILRAPGYADHPERQDAVRRATQFVCSGITEPLLQVSTYEGGYDVRAWASCYGARFLLALEEYKAVPPELAGEVKQALGWYLSALQQFEIPVTGGWNYARDAGAETPSATSGFMTPVCLQTLYQAKAQGYPVDSAVVTRALEALARCRTPDGNVAYSAMKQARMQSKMIPGAVGRMVASEAALALAGRTDNAQVSRAVQAFIDYWIELERRRAKNGTHTPPYGVAPYYFWFAHYHAAQAVELLPAHDRPALRARLNWLLWQTRAADGTWNDRVFPRSAAYGSAMAVMSATMPESFPPKSWN